MINEEIERTLAREREARKEAEKKLEELSSKLYFTADKLRKSNGRLKSEIARTHKTLNLLNVFTAKLKKHNSLKAILGEIISTIISNLNFEDCVIYLVDYDSGYLYQEAGFGNKRSENGEIVNPIRIKIGEGITGRVAKSGKPRIVRDTSKVPEYICDDKVRYSELAVPIFGLEEEVIGVIDLEHSQKNFFDVEHLQTLTIIADICSSHLLKATIEQKLKKEKLIHRKNETRFKKILETVHESIIIVDLNGNIIYVNPVLTRLTGYHLNDIVNTHFTNYLHPRSKSHAVSNVLAFIKKRKTNISFKVSVLGKRSEDLWLDVNVTTTGKYKVHGVDSVENYIIVGRDITSKLEQREQLRFQQEKYRNIIANMNIGLLEVDLDDKVLYANDSFCEMSEYYLSELLGKSAKKLMLHESSNKTMRVQNAKRKKGISESYEVTVITKSGKERTWLISGAPHYNLDNQLIGTIGVHLDITNTKKTQDALVLSKLKADRARDAEKEFLANMSHEIRNPLNSILGLTNLLYDTPLSLKQKAYLDDISFSSEILRSLVSDILDLTKIAEGKRTIERKIITLSDLCESHMRIVKYKLDGSPVKLKYYFDKNLPPFIYGDQSIINQVLSNLLTNAVKFTEYGDIKFSVALDHMSKGISRVLFTIEDTGIGIDKKEQELVFGRFAQAGKVSTNKAKGTGLGLFICKKLVNLMGGTISLESKQNKGSTFTVSLSFPVCTEKELHIDSTLVQINKAGNKTLHALIVEDNEINIKYLEAVLSKFQITYDSCYNGKEATAYLQKLKYDFVLLDIRMPVMDGYETTMWLRSQTSNNNSAVPIIALTASALLDERDKIIAVGANYHLSKPFSEAQLAEAINIVFKNKQVVSLASKTSKSSNLNIDLKCLKEFYDGNIKDLMNMLCLFEKTMEKEMALIRKSVKEENLDEIRKITHRIKPNFYMVGLGEYEGCILKLESVENKEYLKTIAPLVLDRISEAINKAHNAHNELKSLSKI